MRTKKEPFCEYHMLNQEFRWVSNCDFLYSIKDYNVNGDLVKPSGKCLRCGKQIKIEEKKYKK